jgi:hypothetical protein
MTRDENETRRLAEQAVRAWEQSFLKPDPLTYIRQRLAAALRGPFSSISPSLHPAAGSQMMEALKRQDLQLRRLWDEARREVDQESPAEDLSGVAPAEDDPTAGESGDSFEIRFFCSSTVSSGSAGQDLDSEALGKLKEQFKNQLRQERRRVLQRRHDLHAPTSAQLVKFAQFLARLALPGRQDLAEIAAACGEYGIEVKLEPERIIAVYPDGSQVDWRMIPDGESLVTETSFWGPARSNLGSLESEQALDFVLREVFAFFVLVADGLAWHLSKA